MTPLHVAAVYGHNKITKLLLEYGANIRPRDEENGTPLHLAAGEGNLEVNKSIWMTIFAKLPMLFGFALQWLVATSFCGI